MKKPQLVVVTIIAAFLCGCSNNDNTLEETSLEKTQNMSPTETVFENETETLSAVEQEFERAKENNRFPDFELSYEKDAGNDIIYRFYNAEHELEVLTDNSSYATINCNDKTLTINEGFTFFGGTGDYTGMGFEDCTGDGKEELVICITYGGTDNEPSKYRIVEPETMTLYNLSEDIETADIWDRIDNAINYEAVSVITLDKFQYVVGKFVQKDGTVHYTRDNKDSCELPDVLTEIEAMCAKTVRVGTYNGKLAAKFTVYVTGKNSEISAMNFGSADVWVDITYNSNEKKFEYGDILKTEYRKEIPEENWYVSGDWQQEYDIAVIADYRDVEHISYKGDW